MPIRRDYISGSRNNLFYSSIMLVRKKVRGLKTLVAITFRVQTTFKSRIYTMMNPRIHFRSTPFDYIRFFCRITRLGVHGLCALANPTLRADAEGIPLGRTTALMWGYILTPLPGAYCYAQARNCSWIDKRQDLSSNDEIIKSIEHRNR